MSSLGSARSRLFAIDHWASSVRLVQGQGTRPLDLRPGDRPGPARVRPAGWLSAGVGGDSRCRDGVAGRLPSCLRDGGERAGSGVAPALGDHEVRSGPLPRRAPTNCGASLRQRLVGNLGDAADSILRFVESGAGADALALAVVCQVVFGEGERPTLDAAAARMEQYHGNKPISQVDGPGLGPGRRRMPLPIWTARKTPASPSSTFSGPTNCCGNSAATITPTATG